MRGFFFAIIALLIGLTSWGSAFSSSLKMVDEFGSTALMRATEQDDAKAVQLFIKNGARVDEQNVAGVTALHIAARRNSVASGRILIGRGANVNMADVEGFTPLMRACLGQNAEMTDLLVRNGAQVWKANFFDETAVMHCAMSDSVECLKAIRDNAKSSGAELQSLDKKYNEAILVVERKENEEMRKIVSGIYKKTLPGSEPKNATATQTIDPKKKKPDEIINLIYIFKGRVEKLLEKNQGK
ncbi:MAG: ankyrin repeat domain-containing protein [Rickettsiales bacterium]|jgi:ankyrin repeat protein|nr:ankyrin repeat domain-containing protein [Rickettsiales bacterium]